MGSWGRRCWREQTNEQIQSSLCETAEHSFMCRLLLLFFWFRAWSQVRINGQNKWFSHLFCAVSCRCYIFHVRTDNESWLMSRFLIFLFKFKVKNFYLLFCMHVKKCVLVAFGMKNTPTVDTICNKHKNAFECRQRRVAESTEPVNGIELCTDPSLLLLVSPMQRWNEFQLRCIISR